MPYSEVFASLDGVFNQVKNVLLNHAEAENVTDWIDPWLRQAKRQRYKGCVPVVLQTYRYLAAQTLRFLLRARFC
jgi:hypothetical protein